MDSATCMLSKPSIGSFIYYKLLTVVPVFIAVLSIIRYSETVYPLMGYVALCLIHASIMYSAKCPHCRYYKNGKKVFSCFIYWKAPKLWKERQTMAGKWIPKYVPFGIAYLSFYPLYWLRFEWELLVIYFLSLASLLASMLKNECSHCHYFECGNNRVPEFLQTSYLEEIGETAQSSNESDSF